MPETAGGAPWQRREPGVVTPEGVRLDLEPVGVGSRGVALILDSIVLFAIDLAFGFGFTTVLSDLPPVIGITIISLVVMFNVFGYHLLFELAWQGQTPGKRQQKLRVLMTDGSQPRASAIVIRNLVRIVDFLPSVYAIGVVTMLANHRSQRLGDLAADTIVVRQRKPGPPVATVDAVDLPTWADALDVAGVGDQDYALARGWVARRPTLTAAAAGELAAQVGTVLRHRVEGVPDGVSDEALIPVVVTLVQRRAR